MNSTASSRSSTPCAPPDGYSSLSTTDGDETWRRKTNLKALREGTFTRDEVSGTIATKSGDGSVDCKLFQVWKKNKPKVQDNGVQKSKLDDDERNALVNRIGTIAVEMYKETGREEFLYNHLHPEIAKKIRSIVDKIYGKEDSVSLLLASIMGQANSSEKQKGKDGGLVGPDVGKERSTTLGESSLKHDRIEAETSSGSAHCPKKPLESNQPSNLFIVTESCPSTVTSTTTSVASSCNIVPPLAQGLGYFRARADPTFWAGPPPQMVTDLGLRPPIPAKTALNTPH